jgi:acetyl-CoA acyltransferase 1
MYTIGIAAGVETMSQNPMTWEGGINPRVDDFPQAASCMMPMGVTSENVAAKFGVDRKTQDAFAANSHRKAAAAQVPWCTEPILLATRLVSCMW